jgi:DNA-binding SARP family transcriptional activator/tetratricopeptide (TPR) repeat protein
MYPSKSSDSAALSVNTQGELQIRLFGEFVFNFRGQPTAVLAWQRSHAKRLLQFLCSAPKFNESRSRVLEALWPGFEDARARNRLHHTVHCVRKALEEIPLASRPQIKLIGDRLEFVPPPHTVVDVQVFLQFLELESEDAVQRLRHIEQALEWYQGVLAPGWDDCSGIDARRVWLSELRLNALYEAVEVAKEVGRSNVVLRYSLQIATLLQTDCDAHCSYALLLCKDGRPDAALLHCQSVREAVKAEDPESLHLLDDTIQSIQRRTNVKAVLVPEVKLASPVLPALPDEEAVSRALVAPPAAVLMGYDTHVQVCTQCIEDPFGSIVSVTGPPGAGKSLLAATVAYRLQPRMRHGALWIDCSGVVDADSLLQALAAGLTPLFCTVQADEVALRQVLQNKEMLLVLDGLQAVSAVVHLVKSLALAGRDTRWLVTAWSALYLLGERVLHIEPSSLTLQQADGAPSFAAQIVQKHCPTAWQPHDARSVRLIEKISAALDGLPLSLEIAAQHLNTMSPNELWSRLQRDPCALMRPGPGEEPNSSEVRLSQSVTTWLEHATAQAGHMLSLLSRCRSWLTRDDIACLLGDAQPGAADALIEHCVRHQFLLRRTRDLASMPWSEFRVPLIASAALRLREDLCDTQWCTARMEAWLRCGHELAHADPGGRETAAARWFDHHIEDIDAIAISWLEQGRLNDLAALCALHAAHWSRVHHAPRLLGWLVGLGETMDRIDAALAPKLLVERARLRVQLSQLPLACDDASRAMARLVSQPNDALREQAVELIQRYGVTKPQATLQAASELSSRGVEAGESLLRVAQLAVRHGQLVQGLSVCNQSVEVFSYFGLRHGLIKAHHYRAKIAYALGNTELALRCLAEVQRVVAHTDDFREAALASLMHANVLLSQMQFSQAIDLASCVIANPEYAADPAIVARGMGVVAWAHYGQGAYPLAQALSAELRERAAQSGRLSLQVNAELLTALVNARRQRPAAAVRSVCFTLDMLAHGKPLSDLQSDLVNVADLAVNLGRRDLALPMARSLQNFSALPDHRLRQWVQERIKALGCLELTAGLGHSHTETMPNYTEVLTSLAAL